MSPDNHLMSVPVKATGERFDPGLPGRLFMTRPRPPARLDAYAYDVWPDGKRVVVNTLTEEATSTTITLVQNWMRSQAR